MIYTYPPIGKLPTTPAPAGVDPDVQPRRGCPETKPQQTSGTDHNYHIPAVSRPYLATKSLRDGY